MAFNERLKEARLKAGLTQDQLVQKAGIKKSTYSGYETGKSEPPMAYIAKFMELLGVDANFLFQDEMDKVDLLILSLEEQEGIKKYRSLSDYGKKSVRSILQNEYERDHPETSFGVDVVHDEVTGENIYS